MLREVATTPPRQPHLGIDVAGVVEAVGANVSGFAPGDAVWGDVLGSFGAFAERVVAPATSPRSPG